jgi:hypothetical protein
MGGSPPGYSYGIARANSQTQRFQQRLLDLRCRVAEEHHRGGCFQPTYIAERKEVNDS